MNKWDKDVQPSSQQEADSLREELDRRLLEVSEELQSARSKLTCVRGYIKGATTPLAKQSAEVKKMVSAAVHEERVRIVIELRQQGWTFKKIDELFGRTGGQSSSVWILKNERIVRYQEHIKKIREEYKSKPFSPLLLDTFELSVRTSNCLENAGIHTVGELVVMREEDLLRTKNFGRKSLKELKQILAERGLRLGMSADEVE